MAESILLSALKSDPHSMFYQDMDSEDWKILNSIKVDVPLQNPVKYEKELKSAIEGITLGGAIFSKQ